MLFEGSGERPCVMRMNPQLVRGVGYGGTRIGFRLFHEGLIVSAWVNLLNLSITALLNQNCFRFDCYHQSELFACHR